LQPLDCVCTVGVIPHSDNNPVQAVGLLTDWIVEDNLVVEICVKHIGASCTGRFYLLTSLTEL